MKTSLAKRFALLVAPFLVIASGCAATPSEEGSNAEGLNASADEIDGKEGDDPRTNMTPIFDGPAEVTPSFASQLQMKYYGGRVLANVKVIAVNWGPNVNSDIKSQVPGFYTRITNSEYFDWLSEYDTTAPTETGQPGTNQHIGRGSYAGQYTITPSVTSTTVQNQDIGAELVRQITAGTLPAPDANTIYMVDFPPGIVIQLGSQQSCNGNFGSFCGYHNTASYNGNKFAYGVLPDISAPQCVRGGCGGSGTNFERATSVHSHELIEAVTDPDVPGTGWIQRGAGRVGDVCHYRTHLHGYNVQLQWSNKNRACIAYTPGTVLAPDTTPTP